MTGANRSVTALQFTKTACFIAVGAMIGASVAPAAGGITAFMATAPVATVDAIFTQVGELAIGDSEEFDSDRMAKEVAQKVLPAMSAGILVPGVLCLLSAPLFELIKSLDPRITLEITEKGPKTVANSLLKEETEKVLNETSSMEDLTEQSFISRLSQALYEKGIHKLILLADDSRDETTN